MRILMWEFTDLFGKDYKHERLSDKFLCRNPPPEANSLNVFEITSYLLGLAMTLAIPQKLRRV